MSNVIDIDAFRKKKELPAVTDPKTQQLPTIPITPRIGELNQSKVTPVKLLTLNGGVESLFLREARRFRFTRMPNPPAFIIMKTDILPPPFPPDSPPPLVA